MRVMIRKPPGAQCARPAQPQLRVPLRHQADPPRLGPPLVTIRFDGNAHLLPRLVGPQLAGLKRPVFTP